MPLDLNGWLVMVCLVVLMSLGVVVGLLALLACLLDGCRKFPTGPGGDE